MQATRKTRRIEHTAGSVLAVRDQGARKRNAVFRRRFFVFLGVCDITPHVQRNIHTLRKPFARFHFRFADTIDDRETAINSVALTKLCKFHQAREPSFAELRTANGLVFFHARSIQGHVDKVNLAFEFRRDITLIDKITLTVRVQTGFEPFFVEKIAKRGHFRNLISRLAEAAKYDFLESRQIAETIRRSNHLFHRGIAVTEPQIVPVIARSFVSYAKITAVRALIRQVYVQISIKGIKIGILAVFFLLDLLLLLLRLLVLLLLNLLILGLLGLFIFILLATLLTLLLGLLLRNLGILLTLLRLSISLYSVILTALLALILVLRRLTLLGLLTVLNILNVLNVLGVLSVLSVLVVTAVTTTMATTSFSTAALLILRLFRFVFDFFYKIISA